MTDNPIKMYKNIWIDTHLRRYTNGKYVGEENFNTVEFNTIHNGIDSSNHSVIPSHKYYNTKKEMTFNPRYSWGCRETGLFIMAGKNVKCYSYFGKRVL